MNRHNATADMPGTQPLLTRLLAQGGRADVQRAIAELIAGRPVMLTDAGLAERLAFPVDGLTPAMLAELRSLAASGPADGLVAGSAPRLRAIRSTISRCPSAILAATTK
jgi:hypothetical protein